MIVDNSLREFAKKHNVQGFINKPLEFESFELLLKKIFPAL